jgi:hypothetical protein
VSKVLNLSDLLSCYTTVIYRISKFFSLIMTEEIVLCLVFIRQLFQFSHLFFGNQLFRPEHHWRDLSSQNAHLVHQNCQRINFTDISYWNAQLGNLDWYHMNVYTWRRNELYFPSSTPLGSTITHKWTLLSKQYVYPQMTMMHCTKFHVSPIDCLQNCEHKLFHFPSLLDPPQVKQKQVDLPVPALRTCTFKKWLS